eukprot:14254775-Alexandrium_andersonii.AAC.1
MKQKQQRQANWSTRMAQFVTKEHGAVAIKTCRRTRDGFANYICKIHSRFIEECLATKYTWRWT